MRLSLDYEDEVCQGHIRLLVTLLQESDPCSLLPAWVFFINRQDLLNLHRLPEWTKRGENGASRYCMTDIKKLGLNFSLYRYECYKYVQDEYKPKSENEEPKIGKYSMCLKYVTRIRKRNYMIPRIPKLNNCIFS